MECVKSIHRDVGMKWSHLVDESIVPSTKVVCVRLRFVESCEHGDQNYKRLENVNGEASMF
jgi:hypothetical protein